MIGSKQGQHHLDTLVVLLLFGVFAVCTLMVLLTGASAYGRLTERDRQASDRRTCVQYVATRVRQADAAGMVTVEPFGTGEALVLRESNTDYATWVYCCDGYLLELYAEEDLDLGPQDGEKIMEAQNLSLELTDGLLSVCITDAQGEETALLLSLRSGEGGTA